jgi:hypothetical protein
LGEVGVIIFLTGEVAIGVRAPAWGNKRVRVYVEDRAFRDVGVLDRNV